MAIVQSVSANGAVVSVEQTRGGVPRVQKLNVPSAEDPGLSKVLFLNLKDGENAALRVSPAARNHAASLNFAFPIYPSSFFQTLVKYKLTCVMNLNQAFTCHTNNLCFALL